MAQLLSFLRTLCITVSIALIVFFLLQAENFFRSRPLDHTPSPPYVSVLTQGQAPGEHPFQTWLFGLFSDIRYGD
ncbi:hypothetical protein NZD89_13705 [Alicyclobacillus fastidiosus]|uniref:Uncharacterized protein n=1 Tax=Alicyclobacillus fastidiosus TaxID=392011 RepID=A0ABY6ZQV8_9BACL|nr:hypothetical protein [Alicyclobacillus fastidiosus]WAH44345.1 hypothetical protein NZD89_13705 [Alicyclobacillus fastidiosus]GMA60676.1 hypothetical protein GCM10025859_11160 [Alicyclobacillus fastidiosus]